MRLLAFIAAAATLALTGCVDTGSPGALSMAAAPPPPKTVVVGDFTVDSDLVVIDHGFSTRLEAKIGAYPILERRQRTAARVNDEIVATIVAVLREAGLNAQPGNAQRASDRDGALFLSGHLRPTEGKGAPKYPGFGPGHGGVVAYMTLARFSWGAPTPVLTFTAERAKAGARLDAKMAKAREADIAAALAAEGTVQVKLSPDVEAQARGIGNTIGAHVVAYAKAHGWVRPPAVAAVEPAKKPAKKKTPKA